MSLINEAIGGEIEKAKKLIAEGAVNQADADGLTPIHHAVELVSVD